MAGEENGDELSIIEVGPVEWTGETAIAFMRTPADQQVMFVRRLLTLTLESAEVEPDAIFAIDFAFQTARWSVLAGFSPEKTAFICNLAWALMQRIMDENQNGSISFPAFEVGCVDFMEERFGVSGVEFSVEEIRRIVQFLVQAFVMKARVICKVMSVDMYIKRASWDRAVFAPAAPPPLCEFWGAWPESIGGAEAFAMARLAGLEERVAFLEARLRRLEAGEVDEGMPAGLGEPLEGRENNLYIVD